MENKLELATTRNFNGVTLNCYVEDGQENSGDFWATREQIGQLLEYSHPSIAIEKIHKRNKERLDKFSTLTKTVKVEGSRTITRELHMYNFKGLLEICRYSNQPKANAIIDFLWDVADEIRRTGMYITTQKLRQLEERVAMLEQQARDDYPVKLLGSIVLARPESISMHEAAHFLVQHGFNTGAVRLFKKCRDKQLLGKRKGRQFNQPTQKAIERGLFETSIANGFRPIAMVTPKGLQFLAEMFASENYPLLMLIEQSESETK